MALQSIPGTPIPWPGINNNHVGAISLSTDATLDAAGEYITYVFMARQAMVISHVGFRAGAVAGAPTADVRIETVGTDGLPTGVLWDTNTNIVTATLVGSTWALHALTASATIAVGQVFAVKVAFNSGTSFIMQAVINTTEDIYNLPYQVLNVGTPTKARLLNGTKVLALGSSTSAFYPLYGCVPATAVTANSFDNTNAAARGLRFQVPFTCRCVGMRPYQGAAVGDFAYVLYNDAGTELSSSSTVIEGDQSGANNAGYSNLYFDNPVTLTAATWYRAVIVPNSATAVNITTITMPSADYLSGTVFGANAHYTTRASAVWDDSATTQIPLVDILIDQLSDTAGGGANRALLHSGVSAVG
jgi:hypothetical protein